MVINKSDKNMERHTIYEDSLVKIVQFTLEEGKIIEYWVYDKEKKYMVFKDVIFISKNDMTD